MLPTRDGGARLRACLAALQRQRPAPDALVVIDSGSRDGSAQAARDAGAQVLEIEPDAFDHGGTRNAAAAELPDGLDVIVFLVQDAVPQGEGCLAALAESACAPGVAAATARQVAPPEAGFLTASTVSASPFASDEPRRTGPFDAADLARLSPSNWRGLLMLDSIAFAVRADLFRAVGFRTTSHGEDALLAFDLLCGGWALLHEPRAVVEHGHDYDAESVARRYRDDARFFRESFGLRVRSGLFSLLKGYRAELRRDRRWLAANSADASAGALRSAKRLRWAQVLAQREGSRGPLGCLPDPRSVPRPDAASTGSAR